MKHNSFSFELTKAITGIEKRGPSCVRNQPVVEGTLHSQCSHVQWETFFIVKRVF